MHERKVLIITCKSYANVRMLDMTEEMYLCTYGSVLLVGMIIYLSSSWILQKCHDNILGCSEHTLRLCLLAFKPPDLNRRAGSGERMLLKHPSRNLPALQ